ncbi:glycine-rich cell wall structural protein 1.0-like isoform X2 [Stylophora pistillata]|uniref:receptor protein-tyrosine kinase n=1 Tax=Stylophora pistillata TaxID=50429 RepID=A0A2B4SGK3_STYPI|nr:glycine-rich cell wall structural protein 1.0-like isoform X2 [Stylophora pistillata]PFX27960.1 hypothetical protein AWC38_SpisGene7293 [Stylophora pistillata]
MVAGDAKADVSRLTLEFIATNLKGNSGPTSTAEYVNTTLQGAVTLVKGVQIWRVPFTGPYKLTVAGASGGNATCSSGGKGAIAVGVVQLTKGTVLHLLIGQKGLPGASGAGGGGGTFVVSNKNTLLGAAGGGGGGGGQILSENGDDGQAAKNGSVYGGVNGLGGSVCAGEDNNAGGGAGFKGNGTCSRNVSCSLSPHPCNESGLAYVNGGLGGDGNGVGGFGGGGAAYNDFGGGGGGYSGGGVSATSYGSRAGGGGSYWSVGLKASNETNSGDGYVLIESRMV